MVLYEAVAPTASSMDEGTLSMDELGRRLCQHVVGMDPRSVGSARDDVAPGDPAAETRLIFQEYLLDTTLTVDDVLQQCGASVLDFVRFECGQSLPDDAR